MTPERLEELIAEFVERSESGEALDSEAFARRHPEAGPELLNALRRLEETERLFPDSAGDVPANIGPFLVLGEIGRGGMGRVLQVEHEDHPGKPLALKLLTTAAWLNPRAVERLRREGQVLQRIDHPGVVRVTEVGVFDGTPFVAMELQEGMSLSQIIQTAHSGDPGSGQALSDRLQLPGDGSGPVRAARIVAKLARAVDAAHAEGLLHRDIKPGNVILRDTGDPVLIDFGLAGGETGPTLTRTGDVLGTPNYMSPEQARGDDLDARTDIYSLGALLYELLTLRPPHGGEDPVAVLESVRSRPVRPVRRIDPEVPRELETIVLRAMAHSRDRRYRNAGSVAGDLEAFLDRRRIRASRPGLAEGVANAWRFRRRELVAAAMTTLIAAVLVLALWKSSADHEAEVRRTLDRAAMAWAAADLGALRSAAMQMRELSPSEPAGEVLLALAEERDLEVTGDAGLKAIEAGARSLRAENATDAVAHLRRAATLAPGSSLPVVMLGMAARRADMLDIAEEELAAAVRLLPSSPDLHRELAQVYRDRERFEDAEASLESAVALAPEEPRLWSELGRVRYSVQFQLPEDQRDFTEALAASTRAIELAGDDVSDAMLLDYANQLDMVRRFDDAQEIYREILEKNPDSASAHYRLAYSLDSAHEEIAAMREYQKVLELRPNNPTALMALAFFFSGARRWEGCEECIAFYDENPEYQDFEKAEDYALRGLRYGRGNLPTRLDVLVQVARRTSAHERFSSLLGELIDQAYANGEEERGARLSKALWEVRQR